MNYLFILFGILYLDEWNRTNRPLHKYVYIYILIIIHPTHSPNPSFPSFIRFCNLPNLKNSVFFHLSYRFNSERNKTLSGNVTQLTGVSRYTRSNSIRSEPTYQFVSVSARLNTEHAASIYRATVETKSPRTVGQPWKAAEKIYKMRHDLPARESILSLRREGACTISL